MSLAARVLREFNATARQAGNLAAALGADAQGKADGIVVDAARAARRRAVGREAEAVGITVAAVADEVRLLLKWAGPEGEECVGRAFGIANEGAKVQEEGPTDPDEALGPANGVESILCILVALLVRLRKAVRAVEKAESNWFSSGLSYLQKMSSANNCHDAMELHHAQLRALYAIIHLVANLLSKIDPTETLFASVGENPDFKASRWKAAVRMGDFYGRGFGFHYKPEIRNILRVVRIARGSVDKTAESDIVNPHLRNMAIMGWGWVYSHATILSNLGLPIEGVSDIGTDDGAPKRPSIQQMRTFMNLVEDPFVAGVGNLTSADTAIDKTFAIPPVFRNQSSGPDDASDDNEEGIYDPPTFTVVGVNEPVQARLISYTLRPIHLPGHREVPVTPEPHKVAESKQNPSIIDEAMDGLQTISTKIDKFLHPGPSAYASGLILHFHGGGFISQSSKSHSLYLREWACDIRDAVILSIDYQLAPEAQYPVALQECVFAYTWAVQNCRRLGTTARRVVLTGDSAGGNLAVAVAMKVAESGFRAPDGLALAYPALFLTQGWSPSRLLSFFDPMLPVSVVETCVKSYVPDGADPETDPFLSPCVASDSMLEKLPPISIASGSLDPLSDDSVYFVHRLRKLGRMDTRLRLIEAMPHGFLSMGSVSPDAKAEMHNIARWAAEYLEVDFRSAIKSASPPRQIQPPRSDEESTREAHSIDGSGQSQQVGSQGVELGLTLPERDE